LGRKLQNEIEVLGARPISTSKLTSVTPIQIWKQIRIGGRLYHQILIIWSGYVYILFKMLFGELIEESGIVDTA